MFERFKLVPRGFDVLESSIALLRRSVAGLYDPDADCLYIVRSKSGPKSSSFDVTAAHELVHAYRDVDKDYWKRIVDFALKDEDLAIAVSCLAEGDAEVVYLFESPAKY